MLLELLQTEQFLLERQARPPCPWTASAFWREFDAGGARAPGALSCLRAFEPRARLLTIQGRVFLVPEEPSARPRLRWLLGQIPDSPVRLGGPGCDHARALTLARREGAPLDGVRVRVGIGRGHVFDLVLGVPVDEEFESESLEDAFLLYLEQLMGEEFIEDWLGAILIERVPSRRGLTVLSAAGLPPNYPLSELGDLLFRGGLGLTLGRRAPEKNDRWVAFELDPDPGSETVQPDRTFVTTCVPEVLGPIFEGVPFASRRFFSERERLVWLEWRPRSSDRSRERRVVEERIDELARSLGGSGVVGAGFGPSKDYVDVLVPFRAEALAELTDASSELVLEGRLRFYDAEYQDLRLELGSG